MLDHIYTKLLSGLQVIRVPMPEVKSVTVLALANTGSRYETLKEQGIAHFFEHIVFKGTKNYPNSQVLASTIDAIGASFNAFTSKEYTGYYVKSASAHIETSLDVVSDMLLVPNIFQEDIDREKGVIIEEINMYEDMPMRHIGDLFENLMYQGSGLGHDTIGTKETVSSITSEDFKRFLKKWYGLSNLVLVVSGDEKVVKSDKMIDLIKKYFSKDAGKREEKGLDIKTIADEKLKIVKDRLSITYKKTEQAHLCLGWPGIKRNDDRKYALSLLSTVLGGNMSSRLFTEVREKRGLCYYVSSDADFYHNTGVFGASAGVDPTRTLEAISVILSEFYALIDGTKPVTAEELKKAKDYTSGSFILGMEDSRSVAQFFGMRQLLMGDTITPTDVLKRYEAVTLEEVNQVARALIKKGECRLAVIGPYKSDKQFAKLLK